MTGLETALAVVQETLVDTGMLDWAGVADRMSPAPARIGRLDDPALGLGVARARARGRRARPRHPVRPRRPDRGRPGGPPDRSGATARSAGRTLPGRVVATFLRGRPTVLDGALVDALAAERARAEGSAW